jgi:hypothetical protein
MLAGVVKARHRRFAEFHHHLRHGNDIGDAFAGRPRDAFRKLVINGYLTSFGLGEPFVFFVSAFLCG